MGDGPPRPAETGRGGGGGSFQILRLSRNGRGGAGSMSDGPAHPAPLVSPRTVASPWHRIWHRKGQVPLPPDPAHRLRTLMEVGGHTTALGGVAEAGLRAAAARMAAALDVPPGGGLIDVGCGGGAVLYAMRLRPARVVGVDPSAPSLALARAALPDALFLPGQADALPVPSGQFDGALSCGVALYFPDLAYTRRALAEMVRVLRPGGRGLLVDLMDAALRDEREALRRASHAPGEYDRLYAGLPHLYHDRAWIADALADLGCRSWPVEVFGPDYGYAPFAFHVAFERAGRATPQAAAWAP